MEPTAYEVTVTVRFPSDGQAVMEDVRGRIKGIPRLQSNAEKTEFEGRMRIAATSGDAASELRKVIEGCGEARGVTPEIQIGEVRAVEWAG